MDGIGVYSTKRAESRREWYSTVKTAAPSPSGINSSTRENPGSGQGRAPDAPHERRWVWSRRRPCSGT